MAIDERAAADTPARSTRPHSLLFAVRLWKEDLAGGSEYRGSVRDVVGGAFRGFRDWSDLVAFMTARMEEDERARTEGVDGGAQWPLEERR